MYIYDAHNWVERMVKTSEMYAAQGKANSAIVKIMRSSLPLIQRGDFTQKLFEQAVRPTGLIEGLESKFGKVKKAGNLHDKSEATFDILNQEFDQKCRAYHVDQVFYEKGIAAGHFDFEAGLRVKFLSYQKVRDSVIPFFGWFGK